MSVITRAVDRRGLRHRLTRDDVGVGYSSTCGALAYVLRESEPLAAAQLEPDHVATHRGMLVARALR